ncbi:hypothetical protein IV203_024401 [Nitzschia inconspicua]|uniref:Uncharacterized protein n=1 Tax=Nitzschia inconspicua TaxID=303405 RepID=A0A9K3PB12_9STRA|nr:hypothetical protein IV203_024401 [Nitzschia inconspicua]
MMSLPESRRAKVLLAILLAVQIVLLGLQFGQKRRTTASSPAQGTEEEDAQTLDYMKAYNEPFAGIHKHKESEYRQLRSKSEKDSSSRGTGLSSNARSFFQAFDLTPTSKSTKAPSEKSTKAPTNKSTKAPKASKSDDFSTPVSETLVDLSMILTFEGESTWDETTESTFENSLAEFSESSINSNFAGAVFNFETSIEVTEVARVTPGRRLLTSQENPDHLRRLQGSSVIVTYTQNMAYETSDPTTFSPTFLAAAPLDTTAGQNEFVQVLVSTGDPVLSTVVDVSSVTVPVSPPTAAPTAINQPTTTATNQPTTTATQPTTTVTTQPTVTATTQPTTTATQPTTTVTTQPTVTATTQPTTTATQPTTTVTTQPTTTATQPTTTVTTQPTVTATTQPTTTATTQPTVTATTQPTTTATTQPTATATNQPTTTATTPPTTTATIVV